MKDADQQVARLGEDLNISQQKLERSQEVQNRWKERSEALVEQLQAEQNRTILAEQAVTKYMNKVQAIKVHYQQVFSWVVYVSSCFTFTIDSNYRWNSSTIKNFSNLDHSILFINSDWMKWI